MDEQGRYKLCFDHTSHEHVYEGIFYKEVGTDFNNGIFKFIKGNQVIEAQVVDDIVNYRD
jgi:hypothetical protein